MKASLRQCCAGDILELVKAGGTAKRFFSTLSSRMAETRKHSRIELTSPTNCLVKVQCRRLNLASSFCEPCMSLAADKR
jgi:hypothetical protein